MHMSEEKQKIVKTGASGDIAFSIVVSFSYLAMITSSFNSLTPTTIFGLMVIGTIYTSLGIYGYAYVANHPNRLMQFSYFAIQIFLSGLIVMLGRGAGFNALLMIPLAGQAVVLLPSRGVYATSIGIMLAYLGAVSLYGGEPALLWNNLITFIAALVFVVVFSQMSVEQEKARTEVERLAHELEEANQQLRQYAVQAEELAITRERNRLAREIHDGVGHYLTTIFMQIQAAEAIYHSDQTKAVGALEKAKELTQSALTDVRRSVAALRFPIEQNGSLVEMINATIKGTEVTGLKSELIVKGTPRPLNPQVELTCYRTAQEGLNNVQKHAHASHVVIQLDYSDPEKVCLSVTDDGTGSDDLSGGFGLMGIRERVHLVDGEMYTNTASGKGFSLSIEVPG